MYILCGVDPKCLYVCENSWKREKRRDAAMRAEQYGLTYQAFDVEAEVATLEVGVRSVPVKHDLSDTLVYQLVVLRPGRDRGECTGRGD